MTFDSRNTLAERLVEVAEEFKKGNHHAYRYARSTLNSLIALVDDEDIVVTQAIVGSISQDFFETTSSMTGGKEFLKELGETLLRLATALKGNDCRAIDSHLRKFIVQIRRRWLQGLKQERPTK